MNTLTIQLDDNVFSKVIAFARRNGKSAEEVVVNLTSTEMEELNAMENLEAMQRDARARLTPSRIKAAFDEVRALNLPPLPGDELPSQR